MIHPVFKFELSKFWSDYLTFNSSMNELQESHLQSIKDKFLRDGDLKYRRGQAEHQGNLWEADVKQEIIAEAIDMVMYAYTNEYKIKQATFMLEQALGRLYDSAQNEHVKNLVLQAMETLNGKRTT